MSRAQIETGSTDGQGRETLSHVSIDLA